MQEMIISDLSACLPQNALSDKMERGKWRVVPYESEFGLIGKMVYTDPNWKSPTLELPLNAKGLYKIFIGINYPKSFLAQACGNPRPHEGAVEIKLTDDLGYTKVAPEDTEGFGPNKMGLGKLVARSIQETYWKTTELDGQSLYFKTPCDPYTQRGQQEMTNLSYVRLVPLTEEEKKMYEKLKPTEETKKGVFIFCTGMLSGNIDGQKDYHPTSIDWFKNEMENVINGDFKVLSVEAIRGNYCCFNSKIGDVGGEDNKWKPEWIDPLEAFVKLGHENGVEVFAAMRMIGGQYPVNYNPISWSSYFWSHTHLCKVTKDGLPTTCLSIAYPEVQDYWLSLLEETLSYGVDGLSIYLHRFNPFVLYEKPVVDDFMKLYGEDPRNLPDDDERYLKLAASYLTTFLRKVRKLIDTKAPGKRLAVSYFGVPTKLDKNPKTWEPIKYNYDVDTWITEGIVDILLPMQGPKPELIQKWANLSKGKVEICPDIFPRHMPGEEFPKRAKKYYDAGATGFCLNDAERRAPRLTEWAIERLLGHKDDLDYLEKAAPTYHRRIPLKSMQGFSCRYSFNNFGDVDVMLADRTPEEIIELEEMMKAGVTYGK